MLIFFPHWKMNVSEDGGEKPVCVKEAVHGRRTAEKLMLNQG